MSSPSITHDPYPCGMDCVWLASDDAGLLAAFVTAGVGPVPIAALEMQAPLVEIEDKILALPKVSGTTVTGANGDLSSFAELVHRGIHVFDWPYFYREANTHRNAYERLAEPSRPISVSDLPMSRAAMTVRLTGLNFASAQEIPIDRLCPCVPNPS